MTNFAYQILTGSKNALESLQKRENKGNCPRLDSV
jgi:hypothetical protein